MFKFSFYYVLSADDTFIFHHPDSTSTTFTKLTNIYILSVLNLIVKQT
jgi:hypothetical protein